MRRAFIVDLSMEEGAAGDLSVGGVFVPNATVDFDDECQIILRAGAEDVTVMARAVQINEAGAGFQIEMTHELRERIVALIEIAKHAILELERRKTLDRTFAAGEAVRRAATGSVPPSTRRSGARVERRMADGSISPVVAFAPTQQDDALADKARAAAIAADFDGDTDD